VLLQCSVRHGSRHTPARPRVPSHSKTTQSPSKRCQVKSKPRMGMRTAPSIEGGGRRAKKRDSLSRRRVLTGHGHRPATATILVVVLLVAALIFLSPSFRFGFGLLSRSSLDRHADLCGHTFQFGFSRSSLDSTCISVCRHPSGLGLGVLVVVRLVSARISVAIPSSFGFGFVSRSSLVFRAGLCRHLPFWVWVCQS